MAQRGIRDETFEALNVFSDGYQHWLDPGWGKLRNLTLQGFIAGRQLTGWRITDKGEAALTEYRRRYAIT